MAVERECERIQSGYAPVWGKSGLMKNCFLNVLLSMIMVPVVFCFPATATGETAEELKEQIKALEKRLEKVEATSEISAAWFEDINSRLKDEVEITGYIDAEIDLTDQKGANNDFRSRHFSVLIGKKINEQWRIFTETEYENAPIINPDDNSQSSGTILLEQVYIERLFMPEIKIRAGRFLTPAGIWLINRYSPFTPTQTKPQHIQKIFPQFLDGALAYGSFNLSDDLISYHIYAANGEGNSGGNDSNQDKALGGRLDLFFPAFYKMKLGVSVLSDKLNDGANMTAKGVDLQFKADRLRFQGEYAVADFSADNSGQSRKSEGYYVQAQYDIEKFTIVYRYDYYAPDNSTDLDKVTVNTGGLNYHWTPYIVSKIENNSYVYTSGAGTPDYTEWILSVAIMF